MWVDANEVSQDGTVPARKTNQMTRGLWPWATWTSVGRSLETQFSLIANVSSNHASCNKIPMKTLNIIKSLCTEAWVSFLVGEHHFLVCEPVHEESEVSWFHRERAWNLCVQDPLRPHPSFDWSWFVTVIVSIGLSQVLRIILKKYQTNLRGLWEPPNWQPVVVRNVGGLGTSNLQLASKIRAVWLMNPWVFTNSGWLISELDCSTIIWKARYPQPVFMQLIFKKYCLFTFLWS